MKFNSLFRTALFPFALGLALITDSAFCASLQFQLLTWNADDATEALPSVAGRKPSAAAPSLGDWLIATSDDALLSDANNPAGAFSHNLVDLMGTDGAMFNLAASLSGSLTLDLLPDDGSNWIVTVSSLSFSGQANAMQAMNQFLVTPESPAALNSSFNVDGIGNRGSWTASGLENWRIQFDLDYFFASSADGDPSPADIDLTFNNKTQTGFLIPVNQLNEVALASLTLDDPVNFFDGDFKDYLRKEIAPRLPVNATYLLVTQMPKTHPNFAAPGLPITISGTIGNTMIAFTTQSLAAAPQISITLRNNRPVIQVQGQSGQQVQLERSTDLVDWQSSEQAISIPESGWCEWQNPDDSEYEFFRAKVLTP